MSPTNFEFEKVDLPTGQDWSYERHSDDPTSTGNYFPNKYAADPPQVDKPAPPEK